MTRARAADRDALMAAMLPRPRAAAPRVEQLDLAGFFARFDAAAPLHLRLGWAATVVTLGAVWPRLLGHAGSFASLDDDAREAALTRAAGVAALAPLLDVLKIVTSLAYFSDARAEAAFRSAP
ncbi:MAG: hypothetical protein IT374_15265 [Polyangiaceae bacterium]|nr:hypothetical protein [Polyangiaceae bacterium]